MSRPLMAKATAVWLVDNTTLTFKQVADFCGMHELEVQGIADGERFYFVHSYYVVPKDINTVVATTNYGVEFASIVQKDNIYGIQPHPEKSSNCGLKILKNFLEL